METEPKTDISHMTEVPPPAPIVRQEPPAGGPMANAVELLKAGVTTEQLKDMMQLQLQWDANEARKAYVAAMAEWKRNPPTIVKQKLVSFEGRTGGKTEYMHATLGDVCAAVVESLASHGFSHRWTMRQAKEEGIYVTCILTHWRGHSEHYEFGPVAPDNSGGKNAIQAVASSTTYAQRYSLLGVIGITTNDLRDDDARAAYGAQEDQFSLTEWIRAAEKAEDLAALADVKDRGFKVIQKRNDPESFAKFKRVVQDRRMTLDPEYAAKVGATREPGAEG